MTRRALTVALAAASALVLTACSSVTVNQDFAPGTDFTTYRTYNWVAHPPPTNPLVDERVRIAVNRELQERGYELVSDGPDFLVGYLVLTEEHVDYQTVNDYWGPSWGYGGLYGPTAASATSRTSAVPYTTGTLVLDFFDPAEEELVWRGSAEGRIHELADPEERQARVDDATDRILDQFPPR